MVFDVNRKVTYQNLRTWYAEMRNQCPHIPCIVIANKIDMNEGAVHRRYKFVEEINCPIEFVSAASGTNPSMASATPMMSLTATAAPRTLVPC